MIKPGIIGYALHRNTLLRNGSNLRRHLFTPSHEPEITYLHTALLAELHEGFVFPFAPAWIIKEFVECDHAAGDYRITGELKDRASNYRGRHPRGGRQSAPGFWVLGHVLVSAGMRSGTGDGL